MNIDIKQIGNSLHATVSVPEKQRDAGYERFYTSDILDEVQRTFAEEKIELVSGPQFVDNKFGPSSAEWVFEKKSIAPSISKSPSSKPRRQSRKKVEKKVDTAS